MKTLATAVLAAGVTSFALTAQTGPLIGFTAAAGSSSLTSQSLCSAPVPVCVPALPQPTAAWAGGFAYDPRDDSTWHTEGTRIMNVDRTSCAQRCLTPAPLSLGAGSLASGLKLNPARDELYVLESVAGTAAITTMGFVATSRCPQRTAVCRLALPSASHHAGAIAFDQKRDVIWVATSVFGVAAPANILLGYRRGDPSCTPFCRLQVTNCFTGSLQAITAATYDECSDTIYLSDGRQTSAQAVIYPAGAVCPTLRPLSCCPLAHPRGEFWYGFDVQSILARRLGSSCLEPRLCPNCPNMTFDAVGAAVPGNNAFGFRFADGPTGSSGFALLNFGGCTTTPFGCGFLYPQLAPPPIAIGPVVLTGTGTCDGQGFIPVPVPNNFNLCRVLLCVQGVVLCRAGGIGLTNAVVVPIGS